MTKTPSSALGGAMPDERSLLDELDEAERVIRECGARHDDLTAIYCRRAADHDGPHEGHSVVTWGDAGDFPPRCDDPDCDGEVSRSEEDARRISDLETQLAHAKAALAGDNEGIRLWMLDCAALVEYHRKRADKAAASASGGADLIAAERRRQIEAEGWTPEHDDHHTDGEMARAAACYALAASAPYWAGRFAAADDVLGAWPSGWDYKRTDPLRMLTKAGALIAAEIDRVRRRDRDGDSDIQPDPYIDTMGAEHVQEYEPGNDDNRT